MDFQLVRKKQQQIIGKKFDEETIIKTAYAYEQETKFREKYKPTFKK